MGKADVVVTIPPWLDAAGGLIGDRYRTQVKVNDVPYILDLRDTPDNGPEVAIQKDNGKGVGGELMIVSLPAATEISSGTLLDFVEAFNWDKLKIPGEAYLVL